MLPRMVLREARMRHAAGRAFSNATDLADHLARGGLPFRQAHEAVGRLVAIALDRGVDLQDLPLDVMREVAPALDERAYAVLDLDAVVDARTSYGGTSLPRVREQIERARTMLAAEGS